MHAQKVIKTRARARAPNQRRLMNFSGGYNYASTATSVSRREPSAKWKLAFFFHRRNIFVCANFIYNVGGIERRCRVGIWNAFIYLWSGVWAQQRHTTRRRHTFNLGLHLCSLNFRVFTLHAPLFVRLLFLVFKIQTSLTSKLSRVRCVVCAPLLRLIVNVKFHLRVDTTRTGRGYWEMAEVC